MRGSRVTQTNRNGADYIMAKLNGVKTIDMVNGEITKVEYGGAVYAKVAHDFEDAQTGDIFLNSRTGGYYEITIRKKDFFGIPRPVRFKNDDGTDNGYMRGCSAHPLFRKATSVSAPFAEMLTAKVEAVEKRVEALEGVKAPQSAPAPLAEGDRVMALANSEFGDIKAGKFGVVDDLDCGYSADPYTIGVKADSGAYCYFRPQDLELAAEDEALKVGDYVVPLQVANTEYSITDTRMTLGKVVEGLHASGDDIRVEVVKHERAEEIGADWSVMSKYFRKATVTEVAAATAPPKPKTGDIVVITANTNASRNKVGDIGKVGESTSYDAIVDVPGKTEGTGNWTMYEDMRLATPAEIEKYEASLVQMEKDAVFTKAGRKPNEYRKGDVVRFTDDYTAIGVVEDENGGRGPDNLVGVRTDREKDSYQGPKIKNVEIVCFAENRVDTQEVA